MNRACASQPIKVPQWCFTDTEGCQRRFEARRKRLQPSRYRSRTRARADRDERIQPVEAQHGRPVVPRVGRQDRTLDRCGVKMEARRDDADRDAAADVEEEHSLQSCRRFYPTCHTDACMPLVTLPEFLS